MSNPTIGLSGSLFAAFGEYKRVYLVPTENDIIKIALLKRNVIGHPTVIFRKSMFLKNKLNYDEKYIMCEDYELWSRAVRYVQVGNIPELLVYYRKHPEQTSKRLKFLKDHNDLSIKVNQIAFLTGEINIATLNLYKKIFQNYESISESDHKMVVENILKANKLKQIYNHQLLESTLNSDFLISFTEI